MDSFKRMSTSMLNAFKPKKTLGRSADNLAGALESTHILPKANTWTTNAGDGNISTHLGSDVEGIIIRNNESDQDDVTSETDPTKIIKEFVSNNNNNGGTQPTISDFVVINNKRRADRIKAVQELFSNIKWFHNHKESHGRYTEERFNKWFGPKRKILLPEFSFQKLGECCRKFMVENNLKRDKNDTDWDMSEVPDWRKEYLGISSSTECSEGSESSGEESDVPVKRQGNKSRLEGSNLEKVKHRFENWSMPIEQQRTKLHSMDKGKTTKQNRTIGAKTKLTNRSLPKVEEKNSSEEELPRMKLFSKINKEVKSSMVTKPLGSILKGVQVDTKSHRSVMQSENIATRSTEVSSDDNSEGELINIKPPTKMNKSKRNKAKVLVETPGSSSSEEDQTETKTYGKLTRTKKVVTNKETESGSSTEEEMSRRTTREKSESKKEVKSKKLEKVEFNQGLLDFFQNWQKSELRRATINLNITINPLQKRGDDVVEWFRNFEFITKANGWDDDLRGQRVSLHLKKEAYWQWKNMKERHRHVYNEIKERLIEELGGEEFKSKAAAELFIAKQLDTENTEEFGRRLKKLKKRSDIAITEDMLLDRYLKGIKLSY